MRWPSLIFFFWNNWSLALFGTYPSTADDQSIPVPIQLVPPCAESDHVRVICAKLFSFIYCCKINTLKVLHSEFLNVLLIEKYKTTRIIWTCCIGVPLMFALRVSLGCLVLLSVHSAGGVFSHSFSNTQQMHHFPGHLRLMKMNNNTHWNEVHTFSSPCIPLETIIHQLVSLM